MNLHGVMRLAMVGVITLGTNSADADKSVAPPKNAAPPKPARFEHPSFSAVFPAPPTQTTSTEMVLAGSPPREVHAFVAGAHGQVARVTYVDMPGLFHNMNLLKDPQANRNLMSFAVWGMLRQLSMQTVQRLGGRLQSSEKIGLGDAFGMSFGGPLTTELNGQAANVHGRVYIRGERIFVVVAMHTADAEGSAAAAAFLESFALEPASAPSR